MCGTHGAKLKRCSIVGCTSNARKVGRTLLLTWLKKYQCKQQQELNAVVSAIPSHQPVNFEDEDGGNAEFGPSSRYSIFLAVAVAVDDQYVISLDL